MRHETQLVKQASHYQSVRERLLNPKISVKRSDIDVVQAEVDSLKSKISGLEKALEMREHRISSLELDIADRDARLISQAEMICRLEDSGIVLQGKKKPVALIVAEILEDFPGVTWEDIIGVRRTSLLIKPRHLCMSAVYDQRKDLSTLAIGRIFNRDHTVILHAATKTGVRRPAT